MNPVFKFPVFRSPRNYVKFVVLFFQKFVIKEGIQFRIRIEFIVQREIVTGLKYIQKTSRMGVTGLTSTNSMTMFRQSLMFFMFN